MGGLFSPVWLSPLTTRCHRKLEGSCFHSPLSQLFSLCQYWLPLSFSLIKSFWEFHHISSACSFNQIVRLPRATNPLFSKGRLSLVCRLGVPKRCSKLIQDLCTFFRFGKVPPWPPEIYNLQNRPAFNDLTVHNIFVDRIQKTFII